MSESTTPPPASEPEPPPKPRQPTPLLPWLSTAGFLVLAVALFWVWQHPAIPPAPAPQLEPLERQVAALEARIGRLEQRPQPSAPDLAPLAARITALEQKPAPQPGQAPLPPDLKPVEARIAALEQRPSPLPSPDLKPLDARITALEQRPAPPPPPDLAPIEGRLAALEQRPPVNLAPLETRVAALEKSSGRAAQIEAARIALDAGRKLGSLTNAPPALARFADANPPTEMQLRSEFPDTARAALKAARPDAGGEPLLDRLWSRAQDLVTIREGDRVIVGDSAAGHLARAQAALDAGDLAGAVAAAGSLQGPAAQAMAPWLSRARSLLDARAALASWAANG